MSYTLTATDIVIRDEDKLNIPNEPLNRHRQEYDAWLNEGNVPNPHTPEPLTPRAEADAWLAGGLEIQFTSSTTLSATYSAVEPATSHYNAIATSLAYDGNAFPGGGSVVTITDMDGIGHLFDKNSFKLLVRAVRDFIYATNLYGDGHANSLPSNSVSKSISELEAPNG